jgi:hypothetical protein
MRALTTPDYVYDILIFLRIQKCFLATVTILIWAPNWRHGILVREELVEPTKC